MIMWRHFRAAVLMAVAWVVGAGIVAAGADTQLRYVVIITGHGVRSPTWDNARLNQYSAWQRPKRAMYFVETQYLAQTLDQMRNATPLTLAAPPANEDVAVAGRESTTRSTGCPWETFEKSLQKAIDSRFVVM